MGESNQFESLQDELQISKGKQSLLIRWKSKYWLNNIEMQREICEAIDRDCAAFWLSVLDTWGLAGTTSEGLRLSKTSNVRLLFTRALPEPAEVILSTDAQITLRRCLQAILVQSQ